MFSIGEFSKITKLPIKTLRFYHEKSILVPAAVDSQTGYRYYDQRNVETARIVVALREMAFTLQEIAEIMAGSEDESDILLYLENQKGRLRERMEKQRDIVEVLDRIIFSEREAMAIMKTSSYKIEEKQLQPMLVAGIRMKGKYSDCGQGFSHIGRKLGRYISGKPLCLYYDGEFREEDADFEPCMPVSKSVDVDGIDVRQLPSGRCVSLVHPGPYDQLGRSYEKVMAYVKEHSYQVELPTREVYLKGPGMIFRGNPKKYLTEIQVPVQS